MATVTNSGIARILAEIGEYLDMQNVAFKPRAYEKAAEAIASLKESVADRYAHGGLEAIEAIPGVGASIAEKIEEFLETGNIRYHRELVRKTPVDLAHLRRVEGLGPRKIKLLYQKLRIRTLDDLERAARAGKICKLAGFGAKSEKNILDGISFVRQSGDRAVLGFVMPEIREIEARLNALDCVLSVSTAGSVRRMRETVGDIDILIVSRNGPRVTDYFVSMPGVVRVYAHGKTKAMVRLENGLDADLRVVPPESYGAALNYFTGSKHHNIALRKIAIEKGYKLNEYGLFLSGAKRKSRIAGKTEAEIYKMLGLSYIEPELREMTGEIYAAQNRKLPKIIGYGELKGDLQVQTNWTDGAASIEEMAYSAMRAGLSYIVITDHTKRLAMTHGLDDRRVMEQTLVIRALNAKFKKQRKRFRILAGTECDILPDGTLDLTNRTLSALDVVGVAVHSNFNLSRAAQTKRIERAMRNPHVDILFHPTGRVINRRAPYDVDVPFLIKIARETGTVLEVDAYPNRLDLVDEYVRLCVDTGVKLSIDSDAHAPEHFIYLEFGIAQARRGWAKRSDVVNAWPLGRMLAMLKKKR